MRVTIAVHGLERILDREVVRDERGAKRERLGAGFRRAARADAADERAPLDGPPPYLHTA